MSSYPPSGDYDEQLLDKAPKATRAQRQEGYNVNLLASDNSETPINARPPATVDGHTTSLEAGVPPTKEGYLSPYPVPWYRRKKWWFFILIAALIVIGAVVGGVVGSRKNNSKSNSSSTPTGPSTVTLTPSTGVPISLSSGSAALPTEIPSQSTAPSPTESSAVSSHPAGGSFK